VSGGFDVKTRSAHTTPLDMTGDRSAGFALAIVRATVYHGIAIATSAAMMRRGRPG